VLWHNILFRVNVVSKILQKLEVNILFSIEVLENLNTTILHISIFQIFSNTRNFITLVSCSAYLFDPEDGGDVPPKRRLTLNRLHGIISQKMVLFTTALVQLSTMQLRYWPICSELMIHTVDRSVSVPFALDGIFLLIEGWNICSVTIRYKIYWLHT
jgi:hypothetical protein